MRVIQLLPTLSYGDAVGNDTVAIKKILQDMGFDTQIYAENIDPRLPAGMVDSVKVMPELDDEDVIIYHGSTGSDLNYQLPKMKGKKVMIYHNITPPAFFHDYNTGAESLTLDGLKGIRNLAGAVDYCIADSEFNKQDLLRMGFTCPIDVCPILIPFEDYEAQPDKGVIRKYTDDGYTNLLFVGRIAPNKKQENIIRAFYIYHKYFNPKSRLILVGAWGGMEKYYERLEDYVKLLGLEEDVVFTGHIKFKEILAYYHMADAFVCMSEHEGFCVPLVEAMFFNLPIVAYDSCAVPGTLGGSGLLLESNEPIAVAKAIDRIINNEGLREEILAGQKKRLEDFQYEPVKQCLEKLISGAISGQPKKQRRIVQFSSTISRGDAVSNDIMAFQNAIISMGYPSEIYTEFPPRGNGWEMIKDEKELPELDENDMVIYHHATGTDMSVRFSHLPCKKVMVYHNVTPPEFFAPFDQGAAKSCERGLADAVKMGGYIDRAIADSEFNKEDLRRMGYKCQIDVCPILVPFDDYKQEPDAETINTYSDGRTNVVFVGRVAPNKKFEDVISAFAQYKRLDKDARLILVGSYDAQGDYYQFLQKHVKKLGVEDVIFTGHIAFAKILAYYRVANIFLCMSEHEGFCVPLIEAMYFNAPIVAYASTAIPGTLGGSGVLLETKEPAVVADAMWKLTQDNSYRQKILEGQRKRLEYFSYHNTMQVLEGIIKSLIEE